jgi:hypothetical protein
VTASVQEKRVIKVDLDGALRQLFRATYLIVERAAVGMQAVKSLDAVPPALSGEGPINLGILLEPRPMEQVRDDFTSWLLTATFRESIEEVSYFLENVRQVAALIRHVGPDGASARVVKEHALPTGPEAVSFNKLPLPGKLEHLKDAYGLESSFTDMILSINRTRNCFVHRAGIVGEKDCKNGQMVLNMLGSWAVVRDPAGAESEVALPYLKRKDHEVSLNIGPRDRVFKLGERVMLSVNDVAFVHVTIDRFALSVNEGVRAFANRSGPQQGSGP